MRGKNVIIIDDIVDTGSSVVSPANYLFMQGAEEIDVCCTHGIFSEKKVGNRIEYAEGRLARSKIKGITTNSLAQKHEGYWDSCIKWLEVISIAPHFATLMYCNQIGESVSTYIENMEHTIRNDHQSLEVNHGSPYVIDVKKE